MMVSCEPWKVSILRLVRGGGRRFIEDNSVSCEWNWMGEIVADSPDVGAHVEGSHAGWGIFVAGLARVEVWAVGRGL